MFQSITDITTGPTYLQMSLDNRDGCLRVELRSITYTVGWFNVTKDEKVVSSKRVAKVVRPGLWTLQQLRLHLSSSFKDLILTPDETTRLLQLDVQPEQGNVQFSEGLTKLLGFKQTLFKAGGRYSGQRPVNFSPNRLLFIHLEQLNTTENALNGAPSSLLAVVAVEGWAYGEIKTSVIPNPAFKTLRQGTLSELELAIRDERGNRIDNHSLPVSVVLEVK